MEIDVMESGYTHLGQMTQSLVQHYDYLNQVDSESKCVKSA